MLNQLGAFLPLAEKIIPKTKSEDILKYICFENGYMRVTNSNLTLKAPIDIKVNALILLEHLKKVIKTKPTSLSIKILNDKTLKIIFDNKDLIIPYKNINEYPAELALTFEKAAIWDYSVLAQLNKQIPFIVKNDEESVLSEVYITQEKGFGSCAINGHIMRLIKNLDTDNTCTFFKEFSFMLSSSLISLLVKSTKESMDVFTTKDYIKFITSDKVELISLLNNEPYVDYIKIIPEKMTHQISMNKKEFLSAVQNCKPFANTVTCEAIFELHDKAIKIRVENEKALQFETPVPVDNKSLTSVKVVFNLQFIETMLKGIDGETLTWNFIDNKTASLFTNDSNTVILVIPITI